MAGKLRALLAASPTSRDQLDAWYDRSRALEEELGSTFADVELPHSVMHYLHDGDIRAEDATYRNQQNEALMGIIESLEAGAIPENGGGLHASCSPTSLVALAVVIIVAIATWAKIS